MAGRGRISPVVTGVQASPTCGIVGIFGAAEDGVELRRAARKMSAIITHRGPDWAGTHVVGNNAIAHERLSIIDPESGAQPLFSEDGLVSLAVNGEIYNHTALKEGILKGSYFSTGSDCEVINPLYEKFGPTAEMVNHLDGIFAFVQYDETKGTFMAARDPIGVIPLYWGWGPDGSVCFASEMKALQTRCVQFQQFPAGHYFHSDMTEPARWFNPSWLQEPITVPSQPVDLVRLREGFEEAVIKRMMSDVPWGVLLSGGLDSSLVASVAKRHADKQPMWPDLHSFCIGLEGSPDIAAAKKVADYLGTKHHTFTFSIQEALDAVSDVVHSLETYDVTTIRAGTPMFLMARKIKAMGIKMVLSGEGADEMFGGYLYFHKAPNKQEFHEENVAKLQDLLYYDCLRANKAMAAWGVEARVPFLDRYYLDQVMGDIDTADKMCWEGGVVDGKKRIEKWCLRAAFDTPENPFLPDEVLWRQKEQFSDGVGYNWIDSLRDYADETVSDAKFASRERRFVINPPLTKEAYMVREMFESHFPSVAAIETVPGGPSIACSTARAIEWDEDFKRAALAVGGDQSGRSVKGIHNSAYKDVVAIASGRERAEQAAKETPAKL